MVLERVQGDVYPFEWGQVLMFCMFCLPTAFFAFIRADPAVLFEFGSSLV